MKQLPERAEIFKNKMQSGNTMIAAAAEAFGINNTTKNIKHCKYGQSISVYKYGKWTDYDWYLNPESFLFLLAR